MEETVLRDLKQQLENSLRATALLKEQNRRLEQDNEELRDLCCFLDDERQTGRKLARDWQKFGRYTSKVMKQEVTAYQQKLQHLDNFQKGLLKENLELKDLCLYLDDERATKSDPITCQTCGHLVQNTNLDSQTPAGSRPNCNLVINTSDSISIDTSTTGCSASSSVEPVQPQPTSPDSGHHSSSSDSEICKNSLQNQDVSPEVLDVYGIFENSKKDLKKFPTENAIIEEMCNVVWRSLAE